MDPHRQRILSSSISSSQDEYQDEYEIVQNTLDWLQGVVMGLNLCPFAMPSYLQDQIHIRVQRGGNPTDYLAVVLEETWNLVLSKQKNGGTTLVVCPDLFPEDFVEFVGIHNVFQEGVLVDQELTEQIQVAPFHPKFVFANDVDDEYDEDSHDDDADDDDDDNVAIDNYTNRSPYPIFHILREEEVSKAVEILEGDASKVWRRNVDLLNALEQEFEDEQEFLRSVILKGKLQQHECSNGNEDGHESIQDYKRRIQRILQKIKKKNTSVTNKR
eukprot:CAMPEP_0178745028 /NCGR_PEP_ID=MMETSP0744-20121128/7083_1 /TAXON_ID=913974 /ORGANISM="Nitzschia punctata, Strain CCMP561" /LENGTH=271 /DNA_ID=CAMNT_0020398197 /DNA_START=478 /DNA_END=1293 /DNA_ORIENTATION=+